MSNLLKDEKYTITLAGKEYEIPELSWYVICEIEKELNCSITKIQDAFAQKQMATLLSLTYVLLKDKYPEMTKEVIGKQAGLKDIQPVTEKIFEIISKSMGE